MNEQRWVFIFELSDRVMSEAIPLRGLMVAQIGGQEK